MEDISPRLLDFDQTRIPAVPRDAATVIALREGGEGLEVFCVLRHARSAFLGGAVVFPGGKVDPEDGADPFEAAVRAARSMLAVDGVVGVNLSGLASGTSEMASADLMAALGARIGAEPPRHA